MKASSARNFGPLHASTAFWALLNAAGAPESCGKREAAMSTRALFFSRASRKESVLKGIMAFL
eukprot:11356792-Prorocentrum_lima.AAC.1